MSSTASACPLIGTIGPSGIQSSRSLGSYFLFVTRRTSVSVDLSNGAPVPKLSFTCFTRPTSLANDKYAISLVPGRFYPAQTTHVTVSLFRFNVRNFPAGTIVVEKPSTVVVIVACTTPPSQWDTSVAENFWPMDTLPGSTKWGLDGTGRHSAFNGFGSI